MAVSLSARRAWIEITRYISSQRSRSVALRKESVDRNTRIAWEANKAGVALRKESVDRNLYLGRQNPKPAVALRKESVDRNGRIMNVSNGLRTSLSARRAWIEIENTPRALCIVGPSLSARRAWIEILNRCCPRWQAQGRSPQGERG